MIQASSNLESINRVIQPLKPNSLIERIVRKIYKANIPCSEYVENYMRWKWRMMHKPSTMKSSFLAVIRFLTFCYSLGKTELKDIISDDVEAFVEHEQDKGIKVTTARTRLKQVWAFLNFLVNEEVIDASILRRKIRLSVPEFLPRAIAPDDVRSILGAIQNTRDRALILVLLRTGMRIGEVLGLKMIDLDMRERKIHIYEGEKNNLGRVVYLSDDALMALKLWMKERDSKREYLFYGNRGPLCYTAARNIFTRYLRETALQHKGYTVHCLRHSFASELLNAGMRLECLQVLLGHRNIEMTRRYARLTDKSREEEYFRAMEVIEQGGINGAY